MASRSLSLYSIFRWPLIFIAISIRSAIAEYCQGYTNQYGTVFPGFQCPGIFDEFEDYKCCGPSDDHYCCNLEDYNNYYGYFYWSVGKIIGVVIGAIFGVVLFIIIIAIICWGYVRNSKRQQQTTQQMTVTGSQPITQVTTSTQGNPQPGQRQLIYERYGQTYSQPVQTYPQHEQTYSQQGQTYSQQGYPQTHGHPLPVQEEEYPQTLAYAPQGQAYPPPGSTLGYPQHQGHTSPPPSYFSHQSPATGPFAPEVAPPPPSYT